MRPASRKAKGRKLQDWTRDLILQLNNRLWSGYLTEDDVRCAIMGESGDDIKLSTRAKQLLGVVIECKNREKHNVFDHYKHAQQHQEKDNSGMDLEPIVVIKKNHHKPLVVVDAEYFFRMLFERDEV